MCQKALRDKFPTFSPPGLDEYLEAEKAQTNLKSKIAIDHIERMLQSATMSELRQEFPDGENWWVLGVPKPIRKKAMEKYEEDDGKRGAKECYLDLIDYKSIAMNNWPIFEKLIAYGSKGNKEKKVAWLDFVNERRKVVAHSSSGVTVSVSDLSQLQEYETWLDGQLAGTHAESVGPSDTDGE